MRISDWSSDVCSSDLLVVNRTHRLADRSRVEFSDLASDTLLINTECEMVEELKACLDANDIVDTATHQVATQEDLLALLDANLGVAIIPDGESATHAFRRIPLMRPELARTVSASTVAGRPRVAACSTILNLLRHA